MRKTKKTMAQKETAKTFNRARMETTGVTLFVPFDVTHTVHLADALESRVVRRNEQVLVLEPGENRPTLVFVTSQLTYHHVAQGELAGEPYAVTF